MSNLFAKNIRARRKTQRVGSPTELTKQGIRTVGGEDSGLWEAAGKNRDVYRQAHRISSLAYVGQLRHSAIGTTGYATILPASNAGERGISFVDGGEVQNLSVEANGYAGVRFNAAGANEWHAGGTNYGPYSILSAVPSSITLSSFTGSSFTNVANYGVMDISQRGFMFKVQSAAGGDTSMSVHFVTVGGF